MADQLDAYSEWLGIAPHEQPPNYYRLLELSRYEANPERINAHARRQFQRLSPHLGGPHEEIAQALINEITVAGRCLLNAKAKQAYDAQLLASDVSAESAGPSPPVPPPVHPIPKPEESPAPVASSAPSDGERSSDVYMMAPVVASKSDNARARRRRGQRTRFQFIGHLLVPIVSMGIAWAIIKMIRPDFDPVKFLSSSQSEPQQPELSQHEVPAPRPRVSRPERPAQEQDMLNSEPEPEPAPEPRSQDSAPLLEPMAEQANASSIAFLPDAVELPPHDADERFTLAEQASPSEQTPPSGSQCELVLVSDRLRGEPERRLGLTESTSPSGVPTWTVHPRPLTPGDNHETDPPFAEFSWEGGQLKFQWKSASDESLRVALRNSLVNVRIGGEEKLVQLRRPMKVPSLVFDLSKNSLQMPLGISHLPPLEKLRLQVTEVDFYGLEHQLDEGQREVSIGQKIPILVTTPPGARFQIWISSVGNELALRAEGHYWLGSTTPIVFSKDHVERQMKTYVRRGQNAEAAIPRLQSSIAALRSRINAANSRLRRIPRTVEYAHARASLSLQIQGMQASLGAGTIKEQQARRTSEAAKQGIVALQEVAKLGDTIHNQAPFRYRIYLPFEFEGVALEVVLLEAAGRDVTAPENESSTFALDSLADTQLHEPVPSEADRQAARESLAEEYKATYQEANDRASRRRLAATLMEQASDAGDDPPRQFEMFRLAWVILIQAGDLPRALETADEIEHFFEVDRLALRTSIVRAAANASSFSERPSVVVEELLSVIDDAILAEDHDLAIELVDLAQSLHEKGQNARHTQEIEERIVFLEAEQRLAAEDAHLDSNPDDTEAHLRFGRLALRQGRPWDDCLSVLAKGGDVPLAEAARADLSAPDDATGKVALGDRWYDLARSDEELQLRLEERAAKWYSEALPDLQGFSKTKVETRLESLDAAQSQLEQSSLDEGQLAQVELLSGVVRIGELRNGETAFSNRKYVWRNVPSDAPFSRFAMVAGGGKLQVTIKVVDSGMIYIANSSEAEEGPEDLKRNGWEETEYRFNYTDQYNTSMIVYGKYVSAGSVTLPRTGWAGPVVLLP